MATHTHTRTLAARTQLPPASSYSTPSPSRGNGGGKNRALLAILSWGGKAGVFVQFSTLEGSWPSVNHMGHTKA